MPHPVNGPNIPFGYEFLYKMINALIKYERPFHQKYCFCLPKINYYLKTSSLRLGQYLWLPVLISSFLLIFQRLQESLTKKSAILDRDAEYVKNLKVSRLPGYLTVQMVRFQFKQKDAINAKILKDIKFPMMLDCFDYCTPELQEKLVPMRRKFKDYEDAIVMTAQKVGFIICGICSLNGS